MIRAVFLPTFAAALCFPSFAVTAGDFTTQSFGANRPSFNDRAIIIVGGRNPGDTVSLNPQPLPPKTYFGPRSNFGDDVSLNPQPLPPRYRFRR